MVVFLHNFCVKLIDKIKIYVDSVSSKLTIRLESENVDLAKHRLVKVGLGWKTWPLLVNKYLPSIFYSQVLINTVE